MRGASRRTGEVLLVSPADSFAWGVATIATLRHCTLPWYDAAGPPIALSCTPLESVRDAGARDRLSLLAQFSAHQAFLQFAGIADDELDLSDWVVARKRGSDWRLIRVAARATDAALSPPALTSIQAFAERLGAQSLAVFRQSWARAETVYAEAREVLAGDAAADLRWTKRSASGEILSPGPEVLRAIWSGPASRLTWSDRSFTEAVTVLAALDTTTTLVTAGCEFPLHRYGGLESIDVSLAGSPIGEAAAAERMTTVLARSRHAVLVSARIDVASRRAIEIAGALGTASWLVEADEGEVPPTRWFVVTSRLADRRTVEDRLATMSDPRPWIESFVDSAAYGRYLATGEVPAADLLASAGEPKRSYIAALALLGTRIPRATAAAYLADFFFDQPLEELAVPGATRIEEESFLFESESIRASCAQHVPAASRAALCRAAAAVAGDERAAFLLIDAGDVEEGIARLESLEWDDPRRSIETLSTLPVASLSPRLARILGHAYVECGRYRDAATLVPLLEPEEQELLLARCDRRAGDYETALSRMGRVGQDCVEGVLLRCELLRLAGRIEEAAAVIAAARPSTDEQRIRVAYEKALLAMETGSDADTGWTSAEHYFSSRFLSYRALSDADFGSGEQLAREALRLARTPIEEIDARLDVIFASFSSGRWAETRILGLEALTVVDETQGDRAAAGILFTLAYLAADEGQWRSAAATLERLRHYYSATNDTARLFELRLLEAHLEFSRGNFVEARRLAEAALEQDRLLPQIREAAALIVDETMTMEQRREPLRSTGGSGNRELSDRHRLIAARVGVRTLEPALPFNVLLARWQESPQSEPPAAESRSETLKLMRAALASGRRDLADGLTREIGIEIMPVSMHADSNELETLSLAATSPYPFIDGTFGRRRWAFASRNRMGHWNVDGHGGATQSELDRIAAGGDPDWHVCGDHGLLYLEGTGHWSPAARSAIPAIVAARAENHRLRRLIEQDATSEPGRTSASHGIVGESAAVRAVLEAVNRIARRDVPVCILGESGTGKELVARALHRESARRQKAFVAVNCAALPEHLIESELFGHARGAFTGADRDRPGLIETSDSGTLFLDEIGEMPLIAQAKLLRFLQEGEFRRVGETATRSADVRVVTATNRRLESAVDDGTFREDLYYRIRGVEITVPPLRERGHDVLQLARHFLAVERAKHGAGPAAFAEDVEALFRSYRWPGNVRELQNTVRAAHAMAGEAREVGFQHLPERLRSVVPSRVMSGSYQEVVARFRRELIEKSLVEASGNQNRAAALLNMSRQALSYQIRELGILVRKPHSRAV